MKPRLRESNATIEGKELSPLQRAIEDRRNAALTMVVDTAYVWFFVMMTWLFNTYGLAPFGQMVGLDATILKILQIISSVPVVLQAIAFAIVDISSLTYSMIATVQKQWKK